MRVLGAYTRLLIIPSVSAPRLCALLCDKLEGVGQVGGDAYLDATAKKNEQPCRYQGC
jgi:hypothetical protein